MKRLLALSAAASALALTLTGCANYSGSTPAASGSASATGPTLMAAGKLTVCTHLAYKPFQYKDDSNKIVGFDVDIIDVVAKKLGVTQDIVDIEFGQITSCLLYTSDAADEEDSVDLG